MYVLLGQKSLLVLCLVLIFFVGFNLLFNVLSSLHSSMTKNLNIKKSVAPTWVSRDLKSCTSTTNIAYLKTHKCASSAIQLMLFQYGIKHNLNFALPDRLNYFGKGLPFNANMVSKYYTGDLPINIFAIHTKWNTEQVKLVMPNDTIYITSLREPISQFESLYGYVRLDKAYNMTIDQYVKEKPMNTARHQKYIGYNQMAWDMGLSSQQIENETHVLNLIREADETFSLVLIAERLEESLILLRHLFCWTFEDIVMIKVNARRDQFKLPIKEETKELLKQRLAPDFLLYNHFSKKLDGLVDKFGRGKMNEEIKELRRVKEETERRCDLMETEAGKLKGRNKPFSSQVSGYLGKKGDKTCELFTYSEYSLLDVARHIQQAKIFARIGLPSPFMTEEVPLGGFPLSSDNLLEQVKLLQTQNRSFNN